MNWIVKVVARIVDTASAITAGVQGKRSLEESYQDALLAIRGEKRLTDSIYADSAELLSTQSKAAQAVDEIQTKQVLSIVFIVFAVIIAAAVIRLVLLKKS